MTKLLLSIHVLAAILAIGPVAVAASMFPAAVRRAHEQPPGDGAATVRTLHRICRVYAAVGVVVPVFGLATASSLGVLGDAWLIASLVLTTLAAAVLVALVLPGQDAAVAGLDGDAAEQPAPEAAPETAGTAPAAVPAPAPAPRTATGAVPRAAARLAMHTGVFNLLWATVTVLMIVRPGSTTGA